MNIELLKKQKFNKFQQVTAKATLKSGKKITLKQTKKLYYDLKKEFGSKIVIRGLSALRWNTIVSFQKNIEDYGTQYAKAGNVKNKINDFYELEINILKNYN